MFREGEVIGSIFVARRETGALHRLAGPAAEDLRRPGGDRDRKRAPVHRAGQTQSRPHRGAGAADGDERDPARDLELADGRPARVRHHRAARGKTVRAEVAVVSRFDGKLIELAAIDGHRARRREDRPHAVPDAGRRADRDRRASSGTLHVVHLPDVLAEQDYEIKDFARAAQYRSASACPLLRNRQVIGVDLRRTGKAGPVHRHAGRSCSRPSPTRRSSRSRTYGCSRHWTPATATSPRRWSSRRRRARSCA